MEQFDEYAMDTAGSAGIAADEPHEPVDAEFHEEGQPAEDAVCTDDPVR
jgi:hypothetical protein